ncbi:hypothetical protein BP354E_2545 [Burkholderia pseudomallei 354e]|nr:hypothetical protein BP354E_2545 [Burkholderia pseudomallei 354e]EIF79662.1 hypothetical protein BP354A_3126 [Burkholderia pseudomallei 354a]
MRLLMSYFSQAREPPAANPRHVRVSAYSNEE